MNHTIRYEHPLSERIRNFLRLEHLFARFRDTSHSSDVCAHHTALFTLFEIMEAAARAELKLDILQELERQKIMVGQYPQWTAEQQQTRLDALQQAMQNLQNVHQKFGQHLRENEWLMAIKQRMLVPGGTSPFDLPSYFYWQNLDADVRRQQLHQWIQSLLPTYEAIYLLLHILRSNSWVVACETQAGSYQHNSLAQNIHLLAIDVALSHAALPEVSANKYFTHIRFLQASQQQARGKALDGQIPFQLIMCSFDPVIR